MWRLPLCVAIALLGGCSTVQSLIHPSSRVAMQPAVAPSTPAALSSNVPPPVMTVPENYVLTLSWSAVTAYVNGAPLTATPTYKLYSINATTGVVGFLGYMGNVLKTTRVMPGTPTTACYAVSVQVYDPSANESGRTPTLCVAVTGSAPPTMPQPGIPSPVCAN